MSGTRQGTGYYLTVNTGSSSIKFALFAAHGQQRRYDGAITGIGFAAAQLRVSGPGGSEHTQTLPAADQAAALQSLTGWLRQTVDGQIVAVAHRIVHGGPDVAGPCIINDETLARLRTLVPFDPDHLPMELALVDALRGRLPAATHVACFDTAFFHDLPTVARLLPIPRRYEQQGLRRYGFHGLSYTYLLAELARVAGQTAAGGRLIMAHLGNGASLAAIQGGKPIDTTMGLTPAGGVPMSTRSGDLDPGVLTYLAAHERLDAGQLNLLVTAESGLLGVSETTPDMKQLLAVRPHDPRAADAVDLFCYQIKQRIGAYAAALGGLDQLIFSGGIGEQAPHIRAQICDGLGFLGIGLAAPANEQNASVISPPGSAVTVRVIPTDEASVMVKQLADLTGSDA